jgi:hypothetical protein
MMLAVLAVHIQQNTVLHNAARNGNLWVAVAIVQHIRAKHVSHLQYT